MASQHGAPPVFNNKLVAWIDRRLPIFRFIDDGVSHLPDAEEPELLVDLRRHPGGVLVLQIVTGIVLAMHYTPNVDARLQLGRAHHARRATTAG